MTFGMHTSAALIACIAVAGCLRATNLNLISQSSGQYNYAIQLDANQGLVLAGGDQIILSGLSGVTGLRCCQVLPLSLEIRLQRQHR